MQIVKRVLVTAIASVLLVSGMGSAAVAGGAGGGTFVCEMSGVPKWGTVTSKYNHKTKAHYATAIGNGRTTVSKGKGVNAVANQGRAASGNACYWGVS